MTPQHGQNQVDVVLSRRRSHGSSHTLVADVVAKGFNDGLIAALVALGLASEGAARVRLRELRDGDDERTQARIAAIEARERDHA